MCDVSHENVTHQIVYKTPEIFWAGDANAALIL